jgi:hypothetical protein
MIKAYLNSGFGIKICVINNTKQVEMNTIRKSGDLFSKNYMGFGPICCYFYLKTQHSYLLGYNMLLLSENVATWLKI